MKVTLLSGLHLEFHDEGDYYEVPTGDVLVLAGDICTAVDINKQNYHGDIYRKFFVDCANNFDRVFYVMGNHCHYHHNFSNTAKKLREYLPEGVRLLDREVVSYNRWNFMGSTLWTDFGGQNPIAMQLAQGMMNDYNLIRYGAEYRKLTPGDILREHTKTIHWMEETLDQLDGPVFMITHHQPSFESIQGKYKGSQTNCCYATELSNFIMRHPQIKHWVAGHTHESFSYPIDQCQVHCNPRGYLGHGLNPGFDSNYTIELL